MDNGPPTADRSASNPTIKFYPDGQLDLSDPPPAQRAIFDRNRLASPLLRLPQELRDQIISFLYSDTTIHVDLRARPNPFIWAHSGAFHFEFAYRPSSPPTAHPLHAPPRDGAAPWPPLTRVCRQFHGDAQRAQFAAPTWAARKGIALHDFLGVALSPAQRACVTKVALACGDQLPKVFSRGTRRLTEFLPGLEVVYLYNPYVTAGGDGVAREMAERLWERIVESWVDAGVKVVIVDGGERSEGVAQAVGASGMPF